MPRPRPGFSYTTAFQSLYMALAINITDGCALSNEVCRELLLKKSKVKAI